MATGAAGLACSWARSDLPSHCRGVPEVSPVLERGDEVERRRRRRSQVDSSVRIVQ